MADEKFQGEPDMEDVREVYDEELESLDREIALLRPRATHALSVLTAARKMHDRLDAGMITLLRKREALIEDIERQFGSD